MKQLGTPILQPSKEIVNPKWINWEISDMTIKAIEEIEDNSLRAEAYLTYCWHYYV